MTERRLSAQRIVLSELEEVVGCVDSQVLSRVEVACHKLHLELWLQAQLVRVRERHKGVLKRLGLSLGLKRFVLGKWISFVLKESNLLFITRKPHHSIHSKKHRKLLTARHHGKTSGLVLILQARVFLDFDFFGCPLYVFASFQTKLSMVSSTPAIHFMVDIYCNYRIIVILPHFHSTHIVLFIFFVKLVAFSCLPYNNCVVLSSSNIHNVIKELFTNRLRC